MEKAAIIGFANKEIWRAHPRLLRDLPAPAIGSKLSKSRPIDTKKYDSKTGLGGNQGLLFG